MDFRYQRNVTVGLANLKYIHMLVDLSRRAPPPNVGCISETSLHPEVCLATTCDQDRQIVKRSEKRPRKGVYHCGGVGSTSRRVTDLVGAQPHKANSGRNLEHDKGVLQNGVIALHARNKHFHLWQWWRTTTRLFCGRVISFPFWNFRNTGEITGFPREVQTGYLPKAPWLLKLCIQANNACTEACVTLHEISSYGLRWRCVVRKFLSPCSGPPKIYVTGSNRNVTFTTVVMQSVPAQHLESS